MEGVVEERGRERVVIRFNPPIKALSSTIVGGGLRRVRAAIIEHVDDVPLDTDPVALAEAVAEGVGVPPGEAAVFLTAADLSTAYASVAGEVSFVAASLGLEPLACPGERGVGAGTINVLVYVNECLDDPALVELAHMAGAVKAAALASMGMRCGSGLRAFGTVTDAVLVGSRACGGIRYAGPATPHGFEASSLLFGLLLGLGRADEGTWLRRLTGLGQGEVEELVMRAYGEAPVPGVGEDVVRGLVRSVLESELRDPNLWALLIAAAEVDAHGAAGTVPGLGKEGHAGDSPGMIADELLGAAIATYINGWRGLTAYTWVDRGKKALFPEVDRLPMFTDDAVSALVGAVLSKVLDKLVGGRP